MLDAILLKVNFTARYKGELIQAAVAYGDGKILKLLFTYGLSLDDKVQDAGPLPKGCLQKQPYCLMAVLYDNLETLKFIVTYIDHYYVEKVALFSKELAS